MAEVIVKIQAFDAMQKIYVKNTKYSNKPIVEEYSVELDKLVDFLINLNDVHTIHMMGNENFISSYAEQIKEKELAKFNANKLEILINK